MISFFKKYKIEIILFCFAILVRLILFVLTLLKFGEAGFLYYGDSIGYFNLAKNLIYNHIFSQSETPPFTPDFFRTPLYPLFIAIFYFLFKSVTAVILMQNVIGALVPVLIYRLGKLVFSKEVGLASGIFFVLEPNISYWSNELLSETLFVFLLVLCFLFFVRTILFEKKWLNLCCSALFLGLATLTRPISLGVPFIIVIFLYIFLRKQFQFKKIFLMILVFLIISNGLLLPWMVRNKIVFDTFSLTNQGAVVTCTVNENTYLAFKKSEVGEVAAEKMRQQIEIDSENIPPQELFTKYQAKVCKRILRILQIDPVGYFKLYLKSFVPFFLGDGYLTMLHKFFPNNFRIPSVSLWAQISNIGAIGWSEFIKGYSVSEFIVFLFGKLIWILVSIFSLLSIIFAWREPAKRNFIFLFYLLMLYFVTASGFAAYSRFRQPINPILIIMAFYGLFSFVGFFKNRLVKKV